MTNKISIFETRHTIEARSQTYEDEEDMMYTEKIGLQNTGYAYEKIVKSILQIVSHLKKGSDITLTRGSFFFKFNESDQPVLTLATELKTERPIMLLS